MLTITLDGKTYYAPDEDNIAAIKMEAESCIKSGDLVLLPEKSEKIVYNDSGNLDLSKDSSNFMFNKNKEKSEDTLYGRSIEEQIQDHKEQSIITKLREELERNMSSCKVSSDAHVIGRYWQAKETLEFLTSLEEEKETGEVKLTNSNIEFPESSNHVWTPTPGELIEVTSYPWEKMKFKRMNDTGKFPEYKYICTSEEDGHKEDRYLKYARPLPQQIREVIVPELPEVPDFNGDVYQKWATEAQMLTGYGLQIHLLTKAYQALQKHPLFNK